MHRTNKLEKVQMNKTNKDIETERTRGKVTYKMQIDRWSGM